MRISKCIVYFINTVKLKYNNVKYLNNKNKEKYMNIIKC